MTEVFHAYLKAFGSVALSFAVAFIAVASLRCVIKCRVSRCMHQIITLIGTVILFATVLGRLGWSIQTYDGNTPLELLDQTAFLWLTHLGMFLIFMEWILSYLESRPGSDGEKE